MAQCLRNPHYTIKEAPEANEAAKKCLLSNYSVRCFSDEVLAMLEIFLHGGVFAGCVPVRPTHCERDHTSKVNQLIMNKFTQPVLIV